MTIESIIEAMLNKLWIVFAAFAVVMFLFSGVMFLTAQGDAEKTKTARHALLWGVVGVVVGIISYSIISIVGDLIT